ncbi:MAG: hypothetical protein ACTS4Z_00280 [Candidatus Hodgkinia cicadicola]
MKRPNINYSTFLRSFDRIKFISYITRLALIKRTRVSSAGWLNFY